jgi:hypothetical protein
MDLADLRRSSCAVGLLLNPHTNLLKDGRRRFVTTFGSCGVDCWRRTLLSLGHAAGSKIIKRTRSNAVLARSYADRGNVNDSVPGMDWCFFDMCARNMLFGSDQAMSSAPRNSARTP